jgi:GNAT superfamily N-acetyltransferase
MVIRTAVEADTPAIISLMKASLGESLMQKTEAYWRWKHIINPFGISPVLLAEEDGNVVGLRAFMRWRWETQSQVVEAVRAVDTATHPAHQGKGIFSKLTKNALAQCETEGYHLVFNTPNSKSMPGYLKMGWENSGKAPLSFRINPVQILRTFLSSDTNLNNDDMSASYFANHESINSLLEKDRYLTGKVFTTPYKAASLSWRYVDVPVVKYYAAGIEKGGRLEGVFFYRLKKTRFGTEMRITDVFIADPEFIKPLKSIVNCKIAEHKAAYAVISTLGHPQILNGIFSIDQNLFGPVVTLRSIGKFGLEDFRYFKEWSPSVGDLELF